jgi:hypothetical protein
MDVQGRVSDNILKNVLSLTNIVIVHFNSQDLNEENQLKDLKNVINTIK